MIMKNKMNSEWRKLKKYYVSKIWSETRNYAKTIGYHKFTDKKQRRQKRWRIVIKNMENYHQNITKNRLFIISTSFIVYVRKLLIVSIYRLIVTQVLMKNLCETRTYLKYINENEIVEGLTALNCGPSLYNRFSSNNKL